MRTFLVPWMAAMMSWKRSFQLWTYKSLERCNPSSSSKYSAPAASSRSCDGVVVILPGSERGELVDDAGAGEGGLFALEDADDDDVDNAAIVLGLVVWREQDCLRLNATGCWVLLSGVEWSRAEARGR